MTSRSRFHRSRTPMGTVPISVICGYKYPLSPVEFRKPSLAATIQQGPYNTAWPSACYGTESSYPTPPAIVSSLEIHIWGESLK